MSVVGIRPFLLVAGSAEEAATFWCSILPDSHIDSVAQFGQKRTSRRVEFTLAGQQYIVVSASESPPPQFKMSLMIMVETQDEVDRIWDAMTEGGEPGTCGWLTDKYGVTWHVVPEEMQRLIVDPDPERAARVNKAMMEMGKIDLAALRAAADMS